MKFKSITLKGFKRLGFGNVSYFSLEAINYCQLILGINGFGKSMLMKEISPLPGNKNDYYPNGEKIVEIIFNDDEYTLKTVYKNSVKCSFIRKSTNEELNPGGTQSVQAELVRDIFGYTQDIHHLLHSKELFTDMSMKRRREWFIEVSNMNYDYAIYYWNILRDRLRDITGTIKENKKKLVEESSSILSEKEIEKVNNEIVSIEKEINNYNKLIETNNYSNKNNLLQSLLQYKEMLSNLVISILDTIKEKNIYLSRYNDLCNLSKEEINVELDNLLINISNIETEIKLLTEIIDKDKNTYYNTVKHSRIDPIKVKEELDTLQLEYDKISNTLIDNLPLDKDRLTNLISQLIYFVHDKPNEINYISKDEFHLKESLLNEKEDELNKKKEELSELRTHAKLLQEKRNNHYLNCPNCNHSFIPGFNKEDLDNIVSKGKDLANTIKIEESNLDILRKEVLVIKDTYNWLNRYISLNERFSDYKSLFDKIDRSNIKNVPEIVLKPFEDYSLILDKYLNKEKIKSRINELNNLLNTINNLSSISKEDYEKELSDKENRLNSLYKDKDKYSLKRKVLLEINKIFYKDYHEKRLKIESILKDFNEKELEYIKITTSESISNIVSNLKVELGEKIKLNRDIESKLKIVEYITKEIDNLDKKERVFKLLVQELSPQKGLIAEGLKEFIKVFLNNMNVLIKQIWSYPLIVNLPNMDDDNIDLSFRFPMQVGLNDEYIEDVTLGSSGIKEVINLAFKLTAMKSLKLDHYPLFLDEFGASFDQHHRVNAVNVIKNITDERLHSQLFMVSHYESSYGALPNCDVCLLSPEITSPYLNSDTINNHVQIKQGVFNNEQ